MAFLLAAGPAWADSYATYLSPSPVSGGTRDSITGHGHADARLEGDRLTVSGHFEGLASDATAGELRGGTAIGVPGPKLFDLAATHAKAGSVSGTVTLTRDQARELRRGHIYFQLDSQGAPDGNLQGWLLPPHPFAGEDVPVKGHGFLPQLDVPQK